MKKNAVFVVISLIAFSISSCVVHHHPKKVHHDNGKHKGWYKGKGNQRKGRTVIIIPDNNGKSKGHNKSNGKGKGKKK